MSRRRTAARASVASLAMALAAAVSLSFACHIHPNAPLIALILVPIGGLTAVALGVRARSTRLIFAGGAIAFLLLPCGYHAAVLIGGP